MANQPRVVERRKKILELRAQRKTYKEMAQILGVSESLIKRDIKVLLRQDQQRRQRPPDLDLETRRWKAWDARKAGMTVVEVGQLCGVSRTVVGHDLDWCQAQLLEEPVKKARQIDLERLDSLIRGSWDRALAGNEKSAGVVLRCLERRAQIYGYDAPKRVDATIHEVDQADLELQRMIDEAKARADEKHRQVIEQFQRRNAS